MVTKWKNSIRKVAEVLQSEALCVLGVIAVCSGLFLFGYMYEECEHDYGLRIWILVILGNLVLGVGIRILLKRIWNQKYAGWETEEENFYREWKKKCSGLGKWIVIIGVLVCGLVLGYLYWFGSWRVYRLPRFWGSAIVQLVACYSYFVHLRDEKMNSMMEQMAELNRKRVQEALEIERSSLEKVSRSDKLRVELITNISHDLKTPLTSIVGYLELIKKEELSDVVRDYVDVISERADKLKEMIGSLFSLAKASSGSIELHMEKFEVNRLLEQILADMKDKIDESELHFVTQFTEENTELITDNMYFYRICQNLIENALKYSAKGTRVFVKTYVKEGNKLCLEMTNTAGYFMDFKKEDILERFARADQARSTDGNGLGLAIVSTYANALGGEFDIQVDCDQFKAWLVFPSK